MEIDPENSLYPIVEKWLKRHFLCFKTAINKGLKHSRIDVVGVRDIGGDLSGDIETIAIEVKRGMFPFATASGQTLGYNVYANRVYLADVRDKSFTPDEIHIASHLGIGLIQIRGNKCTEVLSSPFYNPIRKLNLGLLETLRLGQCQLCNSFFEIGNTKIKNKNNRYSNLSRENIKRALKNRKGIMFWNREVAVRKNKLGVRTTRDGTTFERRFICPDCMNYFISQLASE